MFIDSAVVTFNAGKGGDGCVSFRREKYIPKGGPNGGDGGSGGSIILLSENSNNSLIDLKFRHVIKAPKGTNGQGSNKTGRSGEDVIVEVPAGTVVKTYPDEKILFDFTEAGQEFIVAKGGKGGLGNSHFKSSINQSPKYSQKGEPGESITVMLELKLIAFAGLVGLPNAGKSTLISKISGAKPKIADYPFTTLTPHLGVVYGDNFDSLVVADIPGIIEGAHEGEGMGLTFLRHIERNKVLIYLLDASPFADQPALETFLMLQEEVQQYKTNMRQKKILVAANKMDLFDEDTRQEADRLKAHCETKRLPYVEISGITGANLREFKNKLFELYHEQ